MKGTQDIFYRKIKSLKEGLPPIFVRIKMTSCYVQSEWSKTYGLLY